MLGGREYLQLQVQRRAAWLQRDFQRLRSDQVGRRASHHIFVRREGGEQIRAPFVGYRGQGDAVGAFQSDCRFRNQSSGFIVYLSAQYRWLGKNSCSEREGG